jgi:subtilisin family serine protease
MANSVRFRILVASAALLALTASHPRTSVADTRLTAWRSGGRAERSILPAGAHEVGAISSQGVLESRVVYDDDVPRRFIVQFTAPPLVAARREKLNLAAVRDPDQRFRADLPGIEASLRASKSVSAASIALGRRLEISFNGEAITASADAVQLLKKLPYVANVFPDDTVRASGTLDQDAHQIRVDSLRVLTGATGAGIVVSIIDTGIDYTHPALGGCFGPGCRVIGGYDFYFSDNDPMDDHGHGTHCAGIAGASGGGLTGMAPGVSFLAYKVLGPQGIGSTSDVIAAIDRSLDPNQDLDLSDRADVISMSLGTQGGNSNDAASQAVDQAVDAGAVCVVAAGNSGAYYRIWSPGTARRAITVGAVNDADAIASFSSRGPATPDYDIKPDVVAPGVGTISTWPGGGTKSLSGTSMATPHVAGVAALLRERHPDWTADRVKRAILAGALDVGRDPFTQGSGRVEATAADSSDLEAQPASLNFGLSPISATVWSTVRGLTLYNESANSRSITFGVASNLPAGSTIDVVPSSLSLAPGESTSVQVTMTLDHAPAASPSPFAFWGTLLVNAPDRSVRVPFGVIRSAQLSIAVDVPSAFVVVHNRSTFSLSYAGTSSVPAQLLIPTGTYDIVAAMGVDRYVVREGIVVTDSQSVSLSASEAIYPLQEVLVDQGGHTGHSDIALRVLRYTATGAGLFTFIFGLPATPYMSPVSTAYAWEWQRHNSDFSDIQYLYRGFRRGISGPVTFQNAPSDLKHLTLHWHPGAGIAGLATYFYMSDGPVGQPFGSGFAVSSFSSMTNAGALTAPFDQSFYYMRPPDPDYQYRSFYIEAYPYDGFNLPDGEPDLATPYVLTEPGQPVSGYVLGNADHPVMTLSSDPVYLGYTPPCWFGGFKNRPDSLWMTAAVGAGNWLFLTQQGDWRDHTLLPYELHRNGVLVESGTIPSFGQVPRASASFIRSIVPGSYSLTISDDRYAIAGAQGSAQVVASFNTTLSDPNPPIMTELSIQHLGVPFESGFLFNPLYVRMHVEDAVALASVTLEYQQPSDPSWHPLSLTESAGTYSTSLSPSAQGRFGLRITARDASGNQFVYTLQPAFQLGSVTAVEPPAPSKLQTFELALDRITPNPGRGGFVVSFTLANSRPARLEVLDIAGRVVHGRAVETLGPGPQRADLRSARRWSPGVYWVRLSSEGRVLTRKACVIE